MKTSLVLLVLTLIFALIGMQTVSAQTPPRPRRPIRIDETKPETKIVKTGLALLRLATNNGALKIEY